MPETTPPDDISPLTYRSLAHFLKNLIYSEENSGKLSTPNMDCRIEIEKFFPTGASNTTLSRYLMKLVDMKFLSTNCGPSGLKTVGYCITSKAVTLVEAELNPQPPFIPSLIDQPIKDLKKVYGKVKGKEKKKLTKETIPPSTVIGPTKDRTNKQLEDAEASLALAVEKLEKLRKEIDQREQSRVRVKVLGGLATSDQAMAGLRIREKILMRLVNEEREHLLRVKSATS